MLDKKAMLTCFVDFFAILQPSYLWLRVAKNLARQSYRIRRLHSPVSQSHGKMWRSVLRQTIEKSIFQ